MLGWELPPHNSGGLGVACYQLAKNLANNGADITFIVPYSAEFDTSFMRILSTRSATTDTMHWVYENVGDESENNSTFVLQDHYSLGVSQHCETESYDIIHAHDWLTFRAGIRAKELLGKPLILHVHSIESDRAGGESGHPLVRQIEEAGFNLADQIVAVSEHTKRKIIDEYGIPADKILVAHNSVDAYTMPPLDNRNAYDYLSQLKSRGYKVVANVGRHTIQKGLYQFLQTAALVIEREPKTIFLLVGDGDQHRELILRSAEMRIARNVLFVGFQRGKAWRDAFAIADLFVMPSVSEPFGLTPLEAAIYNTPSLISYQSGVSEVLANCLKADYWDIERMADQIISVLRHSSLAESLAENAKSELSHHSWDKTAKNILASYRMHAGVAQ